MQRKVEKGRKKTDRQKDRVRERGGGVLDIKSTLKEYCFEL